MCDIKKNPKCFWKYVREKTKTKSGISSLKLPDGTTAETDQAKAEALNNFFSSVFTREDLSTIPTLPDRQFDRLIDNITFT